MNSKINRDLLLVALALATWGIGESMFLYFEPIYLQQLGANPLQIGGILGFVALIMTISFIPAGYLSDRFGRQPLIRLAWLLGTLSTVIMAVSTTLPIFVFAISFYSLTSFVVVPLFSYVTAARGNLSVGRAITTTSAAFNFGAILGPLISGWIGEQVGLRTSFFIAVIFFIISTVIVFLIAPQPVESPAGSEGINSIHSLFEKKIIVYLGIIFLVVFSLYLPQPLSQNFLLNEKGLSLIQVGLLISARSIGVVLMNLSLGRLKERIGFALAQLMMAGFTLIIWLGTGISQFYIGYILLGSYHTARLLATAQGRGLIQSSNMGLGYGLYESVMGMAIVLAPLLAGILYNQNPASVYSVSIILIFISIIVTLVFSPFRGKNSIRMKQLLTNWIQPK